MEMYLEIIQRRNGSRQAPKAWPVVPMTGAPDASSIRLPERERQLELPAEAVDLTSAAAHARRWSCSSMPQCQEAPGTSLNPLGAGQDDPECEWAFHSENFRAGVERPGTSPYMDS